MSDVVAVNGASAPAMESRPAYLGGDWTDERTELLRQLCAENRSYGSMVKIINDETGSSFTRSACLGKVKRLGLYKEPAVVERPEPKRKRKAKAQQQQPVLVSVTEPELPALPIRCTFADLTPKSCRWPFGTPGTDDFFFCGSDRVLTRPYCVLHCCLAYQPLSRGLRGAA